MLRLARHEKSPFNVVHLLFAPWRRYCLLLLLVFLTRAVFVLSVLPPFEGWDEYQHLAYIAFLSQNGRPPVLGSGDSVPRDLYPALSRFPHAPHCVEQIGRHGAMEYAAFWESAKPANGSTTTATTPPDPFPDVPLYQAQHASFYYRLCVPIYRWLWDPDDPLPTVTALRWMNVLFGAAAVYIVLVVVGRLMSDGPPRRLIGLLVCLQPMFLSNCARIANDALAMLLATVVIGLTLTLSTRRITSWGLACGVALGGAVLAKIMNLALAPLVLAAVCGLVWQRRLSIKRAAAFIAIAFGLAGLVTLPYFHFNFTHFGRLTPMQEAIRNQETGLSWNRLHHAIFEEIHWWDEFDRRYTRHALWVGGWSFLRASDQWVRAHMSLIRLSALGFLLVFIPSLRRRGLLFNSEASLILILAACAAYATALCYHMVHSQMALGSLGTNIWYAAATFPWLICLFCQGAAFYSKRWVLPILSLSLAAVFLGAEIEGTLIEMVRCYTGHSWGAIARERMALLHVAGLGPSLTLPSLCLTILLATCAVVNAITCHSERSEESPPLSCGAPLARDA